MHITDLCKDCLNKIFQPCSEPTLNSLSSVCHSFKTLADEQPLWGQKAREWGAADWNRDSELNSKQQAMLFVKKYNYFMTTKIINDCKQISPISSGNLFLDKEAIEQCCNRYHSEFIQEKLVTDLESNFNADKYILDFNQIRHCYALLEAGIQLDNELFHKVILGKAPLALLQSFNKKLSIPIESWNLESAIAVGHPKATISYLIELGADLKEVDFSAAVRGKQSEEIFKMLKEADAPITSMYHTLDLAIEEGVHDPKIIEILVDTLLKKGFEINESHISKGLIYRLPLASMQQLLKSGIVQKSIDYWEAENRSRAESNKRFEMYNQIKRNKGELEAFKMFPDAFKLKMLGYQSEDCGVNFVEWALGKHASLEILQALIAAGAKVAQSFSSVVHRSPKIQPEMMKELLDHGLEVEEEDFYRHKRSLSPEVVKILEVHLSK